MKKYLPIVTIAALGLAGCGGTTEAAAPAVTEESTPAPSASVDGAKAAAKKKDKPSAIDDLLDSADKAAAEPSPIWRCSYSPTYNRDWHDDVVCSNGAHERRPYLREWDSFITRNEIMESAREYERLLNGG